MTATEKFRELLKRLLPQGRAWNRDVSSVLHDTVEGLAVEFSRLEALSISIIEEADPRTTSALIAEWEALVQLPDDCQETVASTLEQRRLDVIRKLTNRGGSSKSFFEALALSVGYTVTVDDSPALLTRCGTARCGDRMYGPAWKFWWSVSAADFELQVARCGTARCGDHLRTFLNSTLECVINRAKPAHTKVQFLYGS